MRVMLLGPDPRLLRIVMRELRHHTRQALLMPAEFSDLNRRARSRMHHVDTGERDVLLQDRRAHAARHRSDLGASDMHAITMADLLVGIDLEPNQHLAWIVLAPDEGLAPDEIVGFRFERHGEADAG